MPSPKLSHRTWTFFKSFIHFRRPSTHPEMDGEHKDYLYKNEISLSIGDDSIDSSVSTPSTGNRGNDYLHNPYYETLKYSLQ